MTNEIIKDLSDLIKDMKFELKPIEGKKQADLSKTERLILKERTRSILAIQTIVFKYLN